MKLLDFVYIEMKNESNQHPSDQLRYFHDYLLVGDILPNDHKLKDFRQNLKSHMIDENIPIWEKALMNRIWCHMSQYSWSIHKCCVRLIATDDQFQRSFHQFEARRELKRVLRDAQSSSKLSQLLWAFENIENIAPNELPNALKNIFEFLTIVNSQYNFTKDGKVVYSALIAASALNKSIHHLCIKKLETYKFVPMTLIIIWLNFYPTLDLSGVANMRFDYHLFLKCKHIHNKISCNGQVYLWGN